MAKQSSLAHPGPGEMGRQLTTGNPRGCPQPQPASLPVPAVVPPCRLERLNTQFLEYFQFTPK